MKSLSLLTLAVFTVFSCSLHSMKTNQTQVWRSAKSFGRGSQPTRSLSSDDVSLGGGKFDPISTSPSSEKVLPLNKVEFLAALISHTPGQQLSEEIKACAPTYVKQGEESKDEYSRKLAYFTVEVQRKLGKVAPEGYDEKSRTLSEKVTQAFDLTKDKEALVKDMYFYHEENLSENTDDDVRKEYLKALAIKDTLNKISVLSKKSKNDMAAFSSTLEQEEKAIQELRDQLEKKEKNRDELQKCHERATYDFHLAMLAFKLKEFDKGQLISFLRDSKKDFEKKIKSIEDDISYIEKSSESKEEKRKEEKEKEAELAGLKNNLNKGPVYYLNS